MKALIFAVLLTNVAVADEKHHSASKPDNNIAIGLAAAGHQFSYGIKSLQGSISTGNYGDSNALSFGIGKRAGKVLISGFVVTDGDKIGTSASLSWKF